MLLSLVALLLSTASVAGAAPFAFIPRSNGSGNGVVAVIDADPATSCPTTGQTPPCVVATLTVGVAPLGVAVNPAGTFAYVANAGDNSLSVIRIADIPGNISSRTVTTITNVGFNPWGVAVSGDNAKIYVGLGDGSVVELDASSGVVSPVISLGVQLTGLAVVGSRLYVGDANNGQVVVIDRNTRNVINNGRIDVGSASIQTPMGLVASPDGTRVYAVDLRLDQDAFVWVLEASAIDTGRVGTTQNPVVRTFLIDPPALSTDPNLNNDTTADAGGIAISADGSLLYVANNAVNSVTTIRVSDGSRADVQVGRFPMGVATDPTGLTYIVNVNDGTVSVLDQTTNTVAKTVTVGPNVANFFIGAFATAGPPQYALNLTANGGSILAQPSLTTKGTYAAGTDVTLTAMPDPGSVFTGWSGDCSGSANPCHVTMDQPKSVTALFTPQYALFLTPLGDGSIGAVPAPGPLAGKYPAGTTVTLTASPGPSSDFTNWAGACAGVTTAICSVTMDAAKSVSATFTLKQFVLTLTPNGTGAGSIAANPGPTGGTYAYNTPVVLNPVPAASSQFTGWGGACAGVTITTCSVTMDAAKTVTATFTLKQYALTVNKAGTGTGTVTPGSGLFDAGSVVTLVAAPGGNSQFTSWSGCTPSGATTCTVTMDAAKTVTATFTLKQYALTVNAAGTGTGTVSPGSGLYDAGSVVTLTATPGANSQLTSWSGCVANGSTCAVTMNAPMTVTATFTLAAQYPLSLNVVGSGTIGAAPTSSTGRYEPGTVVNITAKPAAGYRFSSWSGDCSGTGACNVMMNGPKSVTATCTLAPLTCDNKIEDIKKKAAADTHRVKYGHNVREALRLYSAAMVELWNAKAKVGDSDKKYLRAQKEFDEGKAAFCAGHYWRAAQEFWQAYQIAHEILKNHRR